MPSPQWLSRRDLLRRACYVAGYSVSAPMALQILEGCDTRPHGQSSSPVVLTAAQRGLVVAVAETIIPRSDTPGANDVGVPHFIDLMLRDVYTQSDRERFLRGLDEVDALSMRTYSRSFLQLAAPEKIAILQNMQAAVPAHAAPGPAAGRRPFILLVKELTLLGYFTSEVGCTQVLQYDPIPGAYHGCVPLTKAGRGTAWALDGSLAVF